MTHERQISWSIGRLVGWHHVADSYETVAEDIADRCAHTADPSIAGRTRSKLITDAVIQHRRNRAEYQWVMGPH